MRVLHVIEATIGGTRRHIVDLTRGLARDGVDLTLVAAVEREPAFAGDLRALEREGVHTVELPMVRSIRPGRDLAHLRALERLIARERPDVVHTHSSKAGVLGRLASMSAGVGARVHTPHTFAFLFKDMFGAFQRGIFRSIETTLAGATERVIAVSSSEADTMRASGIVPAERIRVVPNGIDPAPWASAAPASRAGLGLPSGAPLALVAGLLNVAKGQDVAIRALAEPGLEELHLVVAGHGEMHAELEDLARELDVAARVHLLGWRSDVPALAAAADVVVVPSRWEGMPYVALEALAAGRPVVATAVDGAREVVDDQTGALVPIEAPAELARALARVLALSSERRGAMGDTGRRRVNAGYTIDTMVAGMRAVYGEIA
jgi:glycosyltransferase involved in cell wall biosynthesis